MNHQTRSIFMVMVVVLVAAFFFVPSLMLRDKPLLNLGLNIASPFDQTNSINNGNEIEIEEGSKESMSKNELSAPTSTTQTTTQQQDNERIQDPSNSSLYSPSDNQSRNNSSAAQKPAEQSANQEPFDHPSSYREEMVHLLTQIRSHAKSKNNSFALMSNNGLWLLESEGTEAGLGKRFLQALDAVNLEELYWGWEMRDDERTPVSIQQELTYLIQEPKSMGLPIFNIDYASQRAHVDDSYRNNSLQGVIPYTADSRSLSTIASYPSPIFGSNTHDITKLSDARNFLILLNPERYKTKEQYVKALSDTDYDLLIIDLFFHGQPLLAADVNRLKTKKSGGKRLVISYMSVGEAEDYRHYWQDSWSENPPIWISQENEDWQGNYKVLYWTQQWHRILYGQPDSYLDRIISSGFDGVFLDVIDAYQYFEEARG